MEFNKLVSLVLGFIVVVLLLVWVTGRLRGNSSTKLFSKNNVSVTPTKKPTPTPTPKPQANNQKKGWNPFGFLFNKSTPTPSPTKGAGNQVAKNVTPTAAPQAQGGANSGAQTNNGQPTGTSGTNQYQTQNQTQSSENTVTGVNQIPNTGAPTLLIPFALSFLAGGVYLSRMKKK